MVTSSYHWYIFDGDGCACSAYRDVQCNVLQKATRARHSNTSLMFPFTHLFYKKYKKHKKQVSLTSYPTPIKHLTLNGTPLSYPTHVHITITTHNSKTKWHLPHYYPPPYHFSNTLPVTPAKSTPTTLSIKQINHSPSYSPWIHTLIRITH